MYPPPRQWIDSGTCRANRSERGPATLQVRMSRCECRPRKCRARRAFRAVHALPPRSPLSRVFGSLELGYSDGNFPCNTANSASSTSCKGTEGLADEASFAMTANPESIRDAQAFIKLEAMSQTLLYEQSSVEMQPIAWLSFVAKRGICLCSSCARSSAG